MHNLKKEIKRIFLLMGLIVLFFSCDIINNNDKSEKLSDDVYNEVSINNEYSILLPKYLSKAANLNKDASLQYQNIFREAYVIVIDEPKDSFITLFKDLGLYDESLTPLENYSNAQNKSLSDATKEVVYDSGFSDKKINSLPAKFKKLQAKISGIDFEISYWNTYLESESKMYTIMCWTLSDRQKKYDDTFTKVINSFKIL